MYVFTLSGKQLELAKKQGGFILNRRYPFDKDGKFYVPDPEDAKKIAKILVRFHGCKVEAIEDRSVSMDNIIDVLPADGSSAVDVKLPGAAVTGAGADKPKSDDKK